MKKNNIMQLIASCTTEESINKRLRIVSDVFREYNEQIMKITEKEIGYSILEESWLEDLRIK